MVRSHKWGERHTIAGGHVEVGEKLAEALKREVKEEVGLDVFHVRFLMVQEAIFSREFWKRRHFIFFDFVCRCREDRVEVDGDEIQDFTWVRPAKALRLRLDAFTRRMVRRYLADQRTRVRRGRRAGGGL